MKTATNNTHARFFVLMKYFPHLTKEDLVWHHSGMYTTSLSTFLKDRKGAYFTMISNMQKVANSMEPQSKSANTIGASAKDVKAASNLGVTIEFFLTTVKPERSKVLSVLTKYGIDTSDWDMVDAFLLQPRIAGKRFCKMSFDELKAVIPRIKTIMPWKKAKDAERKRLESMN